MTELCLKLVLSVCEPENCRIVGRGKKFTLLFLEIFCCIWCLIIEGRFVLSGFMLSYCRRSNFALSNSERCDSRILVLIYAILVALSWPEIQTC